MSIRRRGCPVRGAPPFGPASARPVAPRPQPVAAGFPAGGQAPKLRALLNPDRGSPASKRDTFVRGPARIPRIGPDTHGGRPTGRSSSGGRHGKAMDKSARDRRRRGAAGRRGHRRHGRDAGRQEGRRDGRRAKAVRPVVLEFSPGDLTRVEAQPLSRWLPVSGAVQPVRQATVKAKVSGDVRQITVREGETVRAGQLLARIDTADLEAKLLERIGALESAKSAARHGRQDPGDQPGAAQAELHLAERVRQLRVELRRVRRARVKSAEAQVQLARNALRDAVATSPLAGSGGQAARAAGREGRRSIPRSSPSST